MIKILASEILDPECYNKMRYQFLYGIISNLDDICEVTASRTYQINWSFSHLCTGNNFLSFVAPYFEHDFVVVKFPDECDSYKDEEFSKQFKEVDDNWTMVEYSGEECEFCEGHTCDRVQYRMELDNHLNEVALLDIMPDQKRFQMYRRFTFIKHGNLGSGVRHKLDDCMQELIVAAFPVTAGKRKRGYEA